MLKRSLSPPSSRLILPCPFAPRQHVEHAGHVLGMEGEAVKEPDRADTNAHWQGFASYPALHCRKLRV